MARSSSLAAAVLGLATACEARHPTDRPTGDPSSDRNASQAGAPIADYVVEAFEDSRGVLWFGTVNRGVARHDGAALTRFDLPLPAEPPAAYAIVPGRVTFQIEDRRGGLWFATDGYGALRHDPAARGAADRPDRTATFGLQALLEDRRGALWAGFSGGLFRLDGSTFVHVTRDGPWE